MIKYTQSHWDEYERLIGSGLNTTAALKKMGIPKGSLGTLKERFDGAAPAPVTAPSNETSTPAQDQSIGGLASILHASTERLLDLAAQMAELTKHAQGLVLLDQALDQLEVRRGEARGLRQRLAQAEAQLIARASVVHSSD